MLKVSMEIGSIKIEIEGSDVDEILSQISGNEFHSFLYELQKLQTTIMKTNDLLTSYISDFVQSSKAESISDKILLCLTYASRNEDESVFNKNDVERLLFEIREALPTNTNAVLNSLEKQGFLIRYKEKKQGLISFYLSQKGIDYTSKLRGEGNGNY